MKFIDIDKQLEKIRPEIDKAIGDVLDSGCFIQGEEVVKLEQELQEYTGASHCITCSNGTDALILALRALGVGPGDGVLIPSFTFAATAGSVALVGAIPIFLDVKSKSHNINGDQIENGVALAHSLGCPAKAVISVDMFGLPAHYTKLEKICIDLELHLIVDGAQSFGASYQNKKVGNILETGITTTSFFPAKPLGCFGDGGAVFTNDSSIAESIRSLRAHGKGDHKYNNIRVGMNARLDSLQAAILRIKLKYFDEDLRSKQIIAEKYDYRISAYVDIPSRFENSSSAWAQYTIQIASQKRRCLIDHLKNHNIPSIIYYPIPLHKQIAYSNYPVVNSSLPISEKLSNTCLSLPFHPNIEDADLDFIAEKVIEGLN